MGFEPRATNEVSLAVGFKSLSEQFSREQLRERETSRQDRAHETNEVSLAVGFKSPSERRDQSVSSLTSSATPVTETDSPNTMSPRYPTAIEPIS